MSSVGTLTMNSAATGLALLFFLPIGVIFGWIARTTAARLDARHPTPGPLWTPKLDELEPVQDSLWADAKRYYDRPNYRELPQHTTINNHFYGAVTGWPSPPRVVDYEPTTHELLP
jgi:hypothetical protein